MNILFRIIIVFLLFFAATFSRGMDYALEKSNQATQLTLFDKYNTEAEVTPSNRANILKVQALSFAMAEEASKAFLQNDFEQFDPSVGDNACQARAIMIAKLARNQSFVDSLKKQIAHIGEKRLKVQGILESETIKDKSNKKDREKQRLSEFLVQKGINFGGSNYLKFITQAYFLTKYTSKREENGRAFYVLDFNNNQCAQDFQLSKELVKNLKGDAQKYLEKTSIEYFQTEAKNIESSKSSSFSRSMGIELAKGIQQKGGSKGRLSVPCFFGLKVILEDMIQCKIPLIMKARSLCGQGMHETLLLYLFDEKEKRFSMYDATKSDYDTSVFVIAGDQYDGTFERFQQECSIKKECQSGKACAAYIDLVEGLRSKNIQEVLLANAAEHPQFPGDALGKSKEIDFEHEELRELKKEFEELKHSARQKGMCLSTMRTFLINHIYPSTIGKALNMQKEAPSDNNNKEELL